jgi:hypothetical protein
MSFEYDIFISYGKTPEDVDPTQASWIQQFCHYLSVALQRLFNEKPTILLHDDLRMRQNTINEHPEETLQKTGVFIVVLDQAELKSEDYRNYLEYIHRISNNINNNYPGNTRIFKIMTGPVPEDIEPDFLKTAPAYNFYEINRYNKKPVGFYLQNGHLPDSKFWSKLIDLSYDIYNSLNIIKTGDTTQYLSKNRHSVFLAETSFDQQENRDILKRELRHMGFNVVPQASMPNDSETAKVMIENYLKQSLMVIHMMGAFYGDFIKNSKYSLIDFQVRTVKEYLESKENKYKPYQIIWIPNDLKTTDQRQSLYLKRIKREESHENTEIVEAPLEVFKTIVNNKLKELTLKPQNIEKNGHTLYLLYEEQEKQKLQEYIELIRDRGFHVIDNMSTYKEFYSITQHIDTLKKSDAVLIYKGNSSMEWLNSKIRDLVKVPGLGKEKPFKAVGIFSPQKTTDKSLLFLRNVTVIWNEELNNAAIHHFLDQIIKK